MGGNTNSNTEVAVSDGHLRHALSPDARGKLTVLDETRTMMQTLVTNGFVDRFNRFGFANEVFASANMHRSRRPRCPDEYSTIT